MSGARGASVIVIGAGATGLSAGWWLARDGVDTLVIDRGLVGWEASGRNGGGCSHHWSPLFAEEQRLWPQMDDLLGYPTEYQPNRVRIALDATQMRRYAAAGINAARYGFVSDTLGPADVRAIVPLAGDVHGGYFFRWGGHANPHRTVQAYAWAFQDHGGRLMQSTVVHGLRQTSGRVTAVLTDVGELRCDHVVLAAGPSVGRLAAPLGVTVPMVSARAEMLVTEPLPLMPIGGVDGNGLYGRQTLRGNLAYGGGPHEWVEEGDGPPARPETPLVRGIAARLRALFPAAAHAHVIRSWAGVVENTPDGRPVIERPSYPGNLTIATLSSIGFGLSPAVGRAVRDLVVDGVCSFADLSTLRLDRFSRLEADWVDRQGWRPGVSPSAAPPP